jgi:hypothetical protein
MAILALAALAGCATTADQRRTDPIAGESLASSVMRAADIQSHRDAPNEFSSAMRARGLGAVTGEDITSAGNVIFGGVSGALFSLTRERGGPDQFSQILAWPPLDYAPSAVEAQRKVWSELTSAISQSMDIAGGAASFETHRGRPRTLTGSVPGEGLSVQWSIPECEVFVQGKCAFILYRREDVLPGVGQGPMANSIGETWAFRRNNGAFQFRPLGQTEELPPRRIAVVDELSFYESISSNLPDWVFIYIAPYTAGYIPVGSDKPFFYPAPVVLNQGLAYYFVEGQREGVPLIRDFGQEAQAAAG